jgi:hypothetical protein
MPILLEEPESDDAASVADYISFRADGMKRDANSLNVLEVSSNATTSFSPSPPYTKSNTAGAAKLGGVEVEMETTKAENGRNPSKRKARKARKTRRQSQSR